MVNADWLFLVSALWFVSCGYGQGVEQGRSELDKLVRLCLFGRVLCMKGVGL